MRPQPPTEFLVSRFGWWRTAVVAASAPSALALMAWWWTSPSSVRTLPAVVAGVMVIAAALTVLRQQPIRLRWDGEYWYVEPSADRSSPEPTGPQEAVAVVDVGPWMLLRLRPVAPPSTRRTVWIPVQRAGHEQQWQGLRRAVYFPRPRSAGRL